MTKCKLSVSNADWDCDSLVWSDRQPKEMCQKKIRKYGSLSLIAPPCTPSYSPNKYQMGLAPGFLYKHCCHLP